MFGLFDTKTGLFKLFPVVTDKYAQSLKIVLLNP